MTRFVAATTVLTALLSWGWGIAVQAALSEPAHLVVSASGAVAIAIGMYCAALSIAWRRLR